MVVGWAFAIAAVDQWYTAVQQHVDFVVLVLLVLQTGRIGSP